MPLCGWGAEPAVSEAEPRLIAAEDRPAAGTSAARLPGPEAKGTQADTASGARRLPPVGAVVGPGGGGAFARRWRSRRDAARGPESREAGQPRDAAEPGDSGDAAQSAGYEVKMQWLRARATELDRPNFESQFLH